MTVAENTPFFPLLLWSWFWGVFYTLTQKVFSSMESQFLIEVTHLLTPLLVFSPFSVSFFPHDLEHPHPHQTPYKLTIQSLLWYINHMLEKIEIRHRYLMRNHWRVISCSIYHRMMEVNSGRKERAVLRRTRNTDVPCLMMGWHPENSLYVESVISGKCIASTWPREHWSLTIQNTVECLLFPFISLMVTGLTGRARAHH